MKQPQREASFARRFLNNLRYLRGLDLESRRRPTISVRSP